MENKSPGPDSIEITSHCLLRYYVALSMEAARLDHCHSRADEELNKISGRMYSPRQWLRILEPYYQKRFCPTSLAEPNAFPESTHHNP